MKYYDINFDIVTKDVIIDNDDNLEESNNINSIVNILNNRMSAITTQFYNDNVKNKVIDINNYIGQKNNQVLCDLLEITITNNIVDIIDIFNNIKIDCAVVPYDAYILFIKLFIGDETMYNYTTLSFTLNIEDGILNVYR